METKICSNCKGEPKPLSKFSKQSNALDGRKAECKDCINERSKKYSRTKEGLITSIYSHQRFSSKQRNHPPPDYTKIELEGWLFSQLLFYKLFEEWVKSGFEKDLTPSCDRKKDDLPYTLDNLQIMTWRNNNLKAAKDHKDGILVFDQISISQYDLEGVFIKDYMSISQASRETGISGASIQAACSQRVKIGKGYQWKYSSDNRIIGKYTSQKKPVVGTHKATGEVLSFTSQSEAGRRLGIKIGDICSCCNGKIKTAGGYTWKFKVSCKFS